MANLKNKNVIWAKGIMFLLIGVIASILVLTKLPDVASVILYFVAIWAFCRTYYFAFYVIEHYVDSDFCFAGLIDFVRYALTNKDDRRT